MSLIVSANQASTFSPIPDGTYLAVCSMLVDIGEQYNERHKKSVKQVVIEWEIPDETYTTSDGKEKPKHVRKFYTLSLNEKSALRKDLAAWRGRDFTADELESFDLRNIVGKSCLVNITHNDSGYEVVTSVMALPKGMEKGKLSDEPIIFDMDVDELKLIEYLPEWLQKKIKDSVTYQEKTLVPPAVNELPDDEEAPF